MAQELTQKFMTYVTDRGVGLTIEEIALKRHVTTQRVHQALRGFRQHVDEVGVALLTGPQDEAIGHAVPNGPDRQLAVSYFYQVEKALALKGVEVEVTVTPTKNGSVFFLTLTSDPTERTT